MPKLPDFLSRHGLDQVEDNVPKGMAVRPSASAFVTLFRDELRARLLNTKVESSSRKT